MSYIPFIMIGVYFLILVFLTLRTPKTTKTSSFEEFYTGSKSMGAIVVGLIMLVTYFSGSTWTGWTGFTASFGVFGVYCIPYSVSAGVIMYLIAGKVWPLGKHYQLSTLADLYELRYRSTALKILSGAIGAVMNITWITMEIVTIGYIINIATAGAVSNAVGSLAGVVFMAGYTLWGGIKSVASVNTFQSVLMVVGSIAVVIFLIYSNYGSVAHMFDIVSQVSPESLTLPGPGGTGTNAQWFSFIFLCSVGVMCYPSLYLKMYLGKSTNEVKKSAIFNAAGGFWSVTFILAGFAIAAYPSVSGTAIDNVEEGLLLILQNSGSPFMFGLTCIFILAACMGTVDGTLLAISGIFSSDVLEGFRRISRKEPPVGEPGYVRQNDAANSSKVVFQTRIIIVIIAICAYIITLFNLPLLVWVAMINYQGIAQLFVPMVGAVLWKKATKAGAFAGIISGFVVTIALMVTGVNLAGFLPGVFGVIVGAAAFIIVSLVTYRPELPEAKFFEELQVAMETYNE